MNRRDWVKQNVLFSSALAATVNELQGQDAPPQGAIANAYSSIQVSGSLESLWSLTTRSGTVHFLPPSFHIDGTARVARLSSLERTAPPFELPNGIVEHRFTGRVAEDTALSLELIFRLAHDSPVVRFRYLLHAPADSKLTGDGTQLSYFSISLRSFDQILEVQLSAFNELLHSYTLAELPVRQSAFDDSTQLAGPILVSSQGGQRSVLVAYEHGAQIPDRFLTYALSPKRDITLNSAKTNYLPGQKADGFATVWMHAAALDDAVDIMAQHYRQFVLRYLSANEETRRPYIFYNTWNFQERNKWFNGQSYLASMHSERILSEIDVAHRMGIDVFVLDTGWYDKTGDWEVSTTLFPDHLAAVRARLDRYGMKLGLWFNPTAAAKSSQMFQTHRHCVRTVDGQEGAPHQIWETEESYPMCLVSPYSDAFADTLIRVAKDTGARYFKWDAIAQYGCDSSQHWHGDLTNSRSDRWNSYAFQLPLEMARVAEKVATAVPGSIVDFDVTESGRAVGLSFLAAGKYFLINNGPYLFNYDLPMDREHQNWNLFFYPGPARTWIGRSPLGYDKWIPSILFLTHYFPDDPRSSQVVNLASLILGQNGIWGDLPAVSPEGVNLIATVISKYKEVREDIVNSDPVVAGEVGTSPEIHEKVFARSGKGAVVLFSPAEGRFRYITKNRPSKEVWWEGEIAIRFDPDQRAIIDVNFRSPGAAIIFFGAGSAA